MANSLTQHSGPAVDPPATKEATDSGMRIDQLQSADQAALLSAIDRLRREHIDADISIPQIVVCGDQSSGKSSVLEAIAGVPFPVSASTTTRFPTEVILRQSHREDISMKVIASKDRSAETKRSIEDFRPSFEPAGTQDFGRLIEEAGQHLQAKEPGNKFWKDWLRAEISGPKQPHLTLVDLPGIIQNEAAPNASIGDKQKIKDLVCKYLEDRRTIVLAIVDAQNNPENQEIVELAQRLAKNRTLGVITKPDRLDSGSDLQNDVIRTAKNEKSRLALGWHVLKNLPHERTDRSQTQRDEAERNFFAQSEFAQLSSQNTGIESLRRKLSEQLFKRIEADLPDLLDEMRTKLRQCKSTVERLGPPRTSEAQQRAYLSTRLNTLRRLIDDALEGDYDKAEFEAFFDGSPQKCLRDRITNETTEFAKVMRDDGRQYHIRGHLSVEKAKASLKEGQWENLDGINFFAPFTSSQDSDETRKIPSKNVEFGIYCQALATFMQETRGKNLPGTTSTKTIRAVFRQLSVPWNRIAEQFIDKCLDVTFVFLKLAVEHVAGGHTGAALLRSYIYPGAHGDGFDTKRTLLDAKLKELLWPYKECHPMTYNPNFNITSVAETKSEGATDNKSARETWKTLAERRNSSSATVSAADALDQTEKYYDIALDTFIENIASLGVERCLLHGLSDIIPATDATDMPKEKLFEIAAEPAHVCQERAKAEAQARALEDVIRICRPHALRGPGEKCAPSFNTIFQTPQFDFKPATRSSNSMRGRTPSRSGAPTSTFAGVSTGPGVSESQTHATPLTNGYPPPGSSSGSDRPEIDPASFNAFSEFLKSNPSLGVFGSTPNLEVIKTATANGLFPPGTGVGAGSASLLQSGSSSGTTFAGKPIAQQV